MEIEIWKDIPGYEGLYQASNTGKIKSFYQSRRYYNNTDGIVLKQLLHNHGYFQVNLINKDGKSKTIFIHKLMAITFLGHKPDGTNKIVVNHRDGNKLNNNLDNLELVTSRYNSTKGNVNRKAKSKFIGIYYDEKFNKWRARIIINKKRIHLGWYKGELEASEAYQKKLKEITN